MVVLILSGGRTLIWLRGSSKFARNKREHHQMVRRNTIFTERSSASATHFLNQVNRPSTINRRSSISSIQQISSSMGETAKKIGRRMSTVSLDIIGYQAKNEHSITDCFRKWEFWLLIYWVSANFFPSQCWINYQFNWLREVGFDYYQIDEYFKLIGWLNLVNLATATIFSLITEKLSLAFSFKKATICVTAFVSVFILVTSLLTATMKLSFGLNVTYLIYFMNITSIFLVYNNINLLVIWS